MRRASYGAGYS